MKVGNGMKVMNKYVKPIFVFCLGIICSGITVYANSYLAKDISFVPKDNNWKVSNVSEALNYLYNNKNNPRGIDLFSGVTWNFGYKGAEDTFVAPVSGIYKLEVWGASGGNGISGGSLNTSALPGYGGYSVGEVTLLANETLYINVGERGKNAVKKKNVEGSYNGGGGGSWDTHDDEASAGGGGATHIAKVSGVLSTLENNISDILIVTGGGGGVSCCIAAASGGGFQGVTLSTTSSTPATQVSGYMFGLGQTGVGSGSTNSYNDGVAGGGGGFYGGLSNSIYKATSGAGGSGYIGNPLLINKTMYCYNCVESSEEATKTISTTNVSSDPISEYAKIGNGYARITFIGVN